MKNNKFTDTNNIKIYFPYYHKSFTLKEINSEFGIDPDNSYVPSQLLEHPANQRGGICGLVSLHNQKKCFSHSNKKKKYEDILIDMKYETRDDTKENLYHFKKKIQIKFLLQERKP